VRTLVSIEESQIRKLDRLAARAGESRAALIRRAVREYLERQTPTAEAEAFGLWGESETDGLAYQERLRAEW